MKIKRQMTAGLLSTAMLISAGPTQAEMSGIAREIAVQRVCQSANWASGAVETWDIANGIITDLGGKIGDVVQLSQPTLSLDRDALGRNIREVMACLTSAGKTP